MSERQRRQAQQERDEMADEMVNSSSGKLVVFTTGVLFETMCSYMGTFVDITIIVCLPGLHYLKRSEG